MSYAEGKITELEAALSESQKLVGEYLDDIQDLVTRRNRWSRRALSAGWTRDSESSGGTSLSSAAVPSSGGAPASVPSSGRATAAGTVLSIGLPIPTALLASGATVSLSAAATVSPSSAAATVSPSTAAATVSSSLVGTAAATVSPSTAAATVSPSSAAAAVSAGLPAPTASSASPPLPPGWTKEWSAEYQIPYYYNAQSDTASWEFPYPGLETQGQREVPGKHSDARPRSRSKRR